MRLEGFGGEDWIYSHSKAFILIVRLLSCKVTTGAAPVYAIKPDLNAFDQQVWRSVSGHMISTRLKPPKTWRHS